MSIVQTPGQQDKPIDLDYLALRKTELKAKIQGQKEQIASSTQNLLSPATFSAYALKTVTKGLNVVDGVLIGYKILRTVRGFFKK